jgi:hypothetical protein
VCGGKVYHEGPNNLQWNVVLFQNDNFFGCLVEVRRSVSRGPRTETHVALAQKLARVKSFQSTKVVV